MLHPFAAAALIILASTSLLAEDRPASPPVLPALHQAMVDQIADNEIAGAVTMVMTPDKVLHLAATGDADREHHIAMQPDSLFWIASMTKLATGLAICKLQEEGKLQLDDPVAKFLPEFHQLKDADGKPVTVTIAQIMTHTSGLEDVHRPQFEGLTQLSELMPYIVSHPVKFPPGSKWEYNQAGINTAGRIVEVLSGMPFDEHLAKTFFEPLQMRDTTFFPSESQRARLAKTYQKEKDGSLRPAEDALKNFGIDPDAHNRPPLPNGGLFSTAGDYGRLAQMLLNDGELDGRRYLEPETVTLFRTIQTAPDIKTGFTPGNGWGVGCCVVKDPQGITARVSPGTYGHGGAFGTQFWIDPVRKRAWLLMVQRANFPNGDASPTREAFQNALLLD